MIPVVLYEGAITLSAGWITHFLDKEALDQVIQQVTATGGILIIGIGIDLLGRERSGGRLTSSHPCCSCGCSGHDSIFHLMLKADMPPNFDKNMLDFIPSRQTRPSSGWPGFHVHHDLKKSLARTFGLGPE